MLFEDYTETKVVYHVAPITDLDKIMKNGIRYDDKKTYVSKYLSFHQYINKFKPKDSPVWLNREKAIFASLNYSGNHCWHSHSVLMALKISPEKCWIANENLANILYEPFILKDTIGFSEAKLYLKEKGEEIVKKYWDTSLSFKENLKIRKDREKRYDAEVMIFHDIKPSEIKLLSIVSDHKNMKIEEWKRFLKGDII
ncbi:hypothetical protein [Sporosalibacterium faouarense]|uniref:hypothetical protein n=1 Tax=Sporosalibacterium faouarense TaxID=516123 RepID=UPI00141D37DF|nr:hypothetical protein [Sporosalibacterium faouarense]MTI46694.1 hypothetical protein [Bacillota bacterium]